MMKLLYHFLIQKIWPKLFFTVKLQSAFSTHPQRLFCFKILGMVKYKCIFPKKTVNLFGGTEMKWIRKMFRLLLSVLLFYHHFGLYFTNRIMYIKKKDHQSILTREKEAGRFNPDNFDSLTKREVTILSPFGYELKIILVEPNPCEPLYHLFPRCNRK